MSVLWDGQLPREDGRPWDQEYENRCVIDEAVKLGKALIE